MAHHPHRSATADPSFRAKSRSTWEVVRRVAVYLRPYKLMAAGTIGCALLSMALSLAYPKLTQFVIDEVIGHKRHDLLTPMMLALLGAFFLRDLFSSLRIRINNTFEQNVIYDMRRQVYARLQRLPVDYFDQRASGDLMTRVVEDVNSVERVLIDGTEQGSVAVLTIVGVAVIMFTTNPVLAAVALVPIPILAAGAILYTRTAHKRYRAQREASSALNALLMDNLQGVRQIKAFGREPHEDTRFAQRADDLRQGTLKVMLAWANYSPAMSFVTALGTVFVLWYSGSQMLAGKMTLGQLVGFLFYLALFYEPVARLHGLNQMLQAARAAGERVFDILDAPVERDKVLPASRRQGMGAQAAKALVSDEPSSAGKMPSAPWRARGELVYENVGFSYSPERVVLKNVSLRAEPGEMVALVGPTGAGKSTLVNLLPAFYEITSGRVTVDGQEIHRMTLDALRAQIAIVSQEPFLFNGTVRENIV